MKKVIEVVLHLLFWFVILIVFPYFSFLSFLKNGYIQELSFYDFLVNRTSLTSTLYFAGYVVGFYALYASVSLALLLSRMRRLVIYMSWSVVVAILMYFMAKGIIIYVIFTSYFIVFSTAGLFAAVVKGIILWLLGISEKKAIQKRQLESENALLLLKAQLNPHFLFNSLNNIDILIEESPKIASDYLKKLSDILRYVLYETKEDETTLAREIEQISNYIELQKIRTANTSYVDFEVIGAVGEQKIVPMIFLPFIENAFKFSKNKFKEHAIVIRFEIETDSIKMNCRNYYEEHHLHILKNEGLGIETIRQRLKLLYPGKHDLEIENAENWFTVTLNIQLEHGH